MADVNELTAKAGLETLHEFCIGNRGGKMCYQSIFKKDRRADPSVSSYV